MLKIFFKISVLCALIISTANYPLFAQNTLGGEADCVVRGKSPVKSFLADGNRLLLLQKLRVTNGSIQLQAFADQDGDLIDINILVLLGTIPDPDAFLNGEVRRFANRSSDLSIKKTNNSTGDVSELSSIFEDDTRGALKGKIKVKSKDNLANGTLRFIFESTNLKITTGEVINKTDNNNGEIVLKCKFSDVPYEIKEAEE